MLNQNSNNSDSQNNKQKPNRFQPRVLYIYFIIIGVIIALFVTNPNSGFSVKEFTIGELIEVVEAGDIIPGEGYMKPDPTFGKEGYSIYVYPC